MHKKYSQIVDLPHFHAPGRPFMSNHDRAAQFMPFKSLKGYDDMVNQKSEKPPLGQDPVVEYFDKYQL